MTSGDFHPCAREVRHDDSAAAAPGDAVAFDPEQIVYPYFLPGPDPPPPVPPDGKLDVRAWFSRPGRFVLRAMALDGVLWSTQDVTVTVHGAQ